MLVREVSRSAAVAWSPLAQRPHLFAAGTLAGTMTKDFDPTGKLEIFDVSELASRATADSLEMPVVGLTSTSERLHRLAWKNPLPDTFHDGLIVGGLGSGAINIWNPTPILERAKTDPLVSSIVSHSGAINALDFNPFQATLLASGGPSGELYIFNLADPRKPTVHSPGANAQSPNSGAITSVAFHPRHRHILAASSQNGTTVIWDLREKRAAFSFSDPNRSFHPKSIAWHPEQPMHIAAASDDDEAPLINIWDLHMTITPSRTLKGHQRGVMSVAWCQADKSLMVSTGKDNRTLCWDVNSATLVSEVGSSANWNLDVQWSPKLPTMLSTCSLDGKVRIYSVSDFENLATPQSMELATNKLHSNMTKSGVSAMMTEDDLFNSKGGANHNAHNHQSSSLLHAARQTENGARVPPRPPAWLRKPCGATFAFGGKLVSFNSASKQIAIQSTAAANSHVLLAQRALALQNAMTSGDLSQFCAEKLSTLAQASPAERETWSFLQSLLQSSPKTQVLTLLDRDPEVLSSLINEYLRTLPTPAGMLEESSDDTRSSTPDSFEKQEPNGFGSHNGISPATTPEPPIDDFFGSDDTFEKFEIPVTAVQAQKQAHKVSQEDDSLPKPKKLGPPISLNSNDKAEQMLTDALLIGDYEAAVECCVRIGRIADALVIAHCGGEKLWNHTRDIFFRQNKSRNYLNIVSAIANKDLEVFIERLELSYWKEGLAVICTYSSNDAEFGLLCAALGRKLEAAHHETEATLCFLCSGSVEQVTSSWLRTLNAKTHSGDAVQKYLDIQELIEKIVVFSAAVKMDPKNTPEIVLQQYTRYAELVANEGMFETALRYLSKLQLTPQALQTPAGFNTAQLLNRVYHALPLKVAQANYPGQLPSIYKSNTQSTTAATKGKTPANTTKAFDNRQPTAFAPGPAYPGPSLNMHAHRTGPQTIPAAGPQAITAFQPPAVFQPQPVATTIPTPAKTVPAPMTTFTPMQPQPPVGMAAAPHMPPPAAHGPRTNFTPIQPGQFAPVQPSPFTPQTPVAGHPVPASAPASAPRNRVKAPPAATFTPSAHAPAPEPAAAAAANGAAAAAPAKKKKGAKKASMKASTESAGSEPEVASKPKMPTTSGSGSVAFAPSTFTPPSLPPASIAPPSLAPAQLGPSPYQPPMQTFPPQMGPSATSTVAMPPPKARTTRIQPPGAARSGPAPMGTGPQGPAAFHPPPSMAMPPGQPDPGTWNPQQPLPPHLTAGLGMPPPHGHNPHAASTPAGFHPPPPTAFVPTQGPGVAPPAHAGMAPPPFQGAPTSFQPPPMGRAPQSPAAALPPPRPGRAKKEVTAALSTPTPVYVTGPQAEAMAAPKNHELSENETALLEAFVAVLDKIQGTGDAAHPDLVSRFEDLKQKMLTGDIPEAAIAPLTELATFMNNSQYKEAQEKHGEVTNSAYYHAIGSKAMLGLKRMIILIAKYSL